MFSILRTGSRNNSRHLLLSRSVTEPASAPDGSRRGSVSSAPAVSRHRLAVLLARSSGWRFASPVFAVLVLLGLTVIVFRQQLFDQWTFPWDFVGAYTTTPAYVAAVIGAGHLPAWSPFVASGFPVALDPQAGLYFPGWWALGGLGIPATLRVLTAVQVAHVLFGACGVLALARARRLGWSWALLAAVAYLFFGGFYGEAEHADIVRGFAYLPWLLWALTPPSQRPRAHAAATDEVPHTWWRLLAVPPVIWLVASGAYPGEVVSFGLCGLVYVGVALRLSTPGTWHRYRGALLLAFLAALGVCFAVLLPYLRAENANELFRVQEPTAAVRAGESVAPRDLLGLFLNNFAWTYDGTVTAWVVGIPVLIGVACTRMRVLHRQAPLIAAGAVALALAMTPKIGFIGSAMASLRPLFPSRFPAADYKAFVAVALVIVAADSWGSLAARRRGLSVSAAVAGVVLLVGAILAPSTYASPTRAFWLVVVVIVACVLFASVRPPVRLLAALLVMLVVVDGGREIYDYKLLGHVSPWRVTPSDAAPYRARDVVVRELPSLLKQAPVTRPARVPPAAPLASNPTGTDSDATGWIAEGYHLIDYGGTSEKVLWQAEHNPSLLALLLAPWTGYTFPCAAVGCARGHVTLPVPSQWTASPSVRTLSYGEEHIVYAVDTRQPVLMVENELAIPGWHSSSVRVTPVKTGLPLRAWRLSPGRYTFTASFHESGRTAQALVALLALLAWIASGLVLGLRRLRLATDR